MDDWVAIATLIGVVLVFSALRKLTAGKRAGVDKDPLHLRAGGNAANRRQEALFVSTFPELQPHFHPQKVLEFIGAWRSRAPSPDVVLWNSAPGFGASRVRLMPKSEKGQPAELLDATGAAAVASFILQEHAEGGVIRLGSGKFTVNLRDAAVRYWHPQREFKWSRAKGWKMIHSLSDREIESGDRGSSFSSDGPSSSFSSSSPSARAGAAMAGAGGAFDGGGASESWDSSSSGGESSASSDSTESRTSY